MPDQPEGHTPDIELDLMSFTAPERRAVQREFDCDFADLVQVVARKFLPLGAVDTSTKVFDGSGTIRFADEILAHMITVQRRRTRPEAQVDELDDWTHPELKAFFPKARKAGGSTPKAETAGSSKKT